MNAGEREHYVATMPLVTLLPPTLADFECRHGLLIGCAVCAGGERNVDEQNELELTVRS